MAVPFGISIGDVITVGSLAYQIAQALSETRGAVSDYSSLIEMLKSLNGSLQTVADFISGPSTEAMVKPDKALINGINYHVQCYLLLIHSPELQLESKKYTESLLSGKGRRVQNEIRKIKWSLYKADDARKLEQRLQGHVDAFQVYLVAISIQSQAQSSDRIKGRLDNIDRSLSEIYTSVQVSKNSLPKTLGFPWQGDNSGNTIYFEDVLGRTMDLPAVFCRDLRSFQDTLEIMFRDLPGYRTICKGDYELVDESEGKLIAFGLPNSFESERESYPVLETTNEWQKKVLPGVRVAMNIILHGRMQAPRSEPLPAVQKQCPRCRTLNSGRISCGFMTCHICRLRFRSSFREKNNFSGADSWPKATFSKRESLRSDVAKAATLNEYHIVHSHTREEQSSPKSTPKEQKPAASAKTSLRKPQEEDVFQRVHYVNDVMIPDNVTGSSMGAWQLSRSMMVHAAAQGDHEWVKQLLKDGSEDTFPDKVGWFPLQYAARYGHISVVRLLLEAGRDVNAPAADFGKTALQAASGGGHEDIVKLLISHGADINAPAPSFGRTALQAASEGGHEDVVKLLISYGADVNASAAAGSGRTALQAASEGGHEDVVKLLISHGADVNASAAAARGRTALQAASMGGHEDVVKLLISHGADINAPAADFGRTALQAASKGGHEDVVKLLISHDADVNASAAAHDGRTALQAASEGGHEDVVKLLISHGADVNASAAGRTALQAASGGGHKDVVKLLISHGADINAPAAKLEKTALQAASRGGHEDVVKLLISHGADVNAPAAEYGGITPLQAASKGGHKDVVKLLISHGANINAPAAGYGKTALQAASEGGHEDIVKLLISHGADVSDQEGEKIEDEYENEDEFEDN